VAAGAALVGYNYREKIYEWMRHHHAADTKDGRPGSSPRQQPK